MLQDHGEFRRRIGSEVDLLLDHFFATDHQEALAELNRDPDIAVRRAIADCGLGWDDQRIRFFTSALVELRRSSTDLILDQRHSSEKRVEASVVAMRRALALVTYMHVAMLFVGIALVTTGIVAALMGQTVTGLTIGGVGFADAALFMIREPVSGLRSNIGTYARIRTAYDTYVTQLGRIGQPYPTDFAQVRAKGQLVDMATIEALKSIEKAEKDTEAHGPHNREGPHED